MRLLASSDVNPYSFWSAGQAFIGWRTIFLGILRSMAVKSVAVLGGGVAGVAAAGTLAADPSMSVTLIEKAPELGGLQSSVEVDGSVYDIGSFLFGEDHELFEVFPSIRDLYVSVQPQLRSITPNGSLDRYPATVRGYLRDRGPLQLGRAAASLVGAKVRHRRRDTLPSLLRYYLGDVFYESTGFKTYLERLYGLPEDEIDLEFADKRLFFLRDVCSLRTRARRAVARAAGADAGFAAPHALVRPREGFGRIFRTVRRELEDRGVQVRTGADVQGVRRSGSGGFVLQSAGASERYDEVVSTLPLSLTARLLGVPLGVEPEYMSLVSLFYKTAGGVGHDATVLSNLTSRGRWKRVTDFSRLYGEPTGHCFTVEVTTRGVDADSVRRMDEDFRGHVQSLGLYREELRLVGHRVTQRAYPVYRRSYMAAVRAARQELERHGVHLIGRQGRFEYIPSDAVAAGAGRLARALGSTAAQA